MMKMKEINKMEEYGITLITLVITIIILLILAGVTIGMATNGTGLFDKAKEAAQKYQNVQEDEEMQIAKYSNEIDSYVGNGRGSVSSKVLFDDKKQVEQLLLKMIKYQIMIV